MSCENATYSERRARMDKILSFKGWMAENNIKQSEIAELLGISIQSVNLKVNGKLDFSLPQVRIICERYGVSADIFLPRELRNSNKVSV
jgi:predicted XRE-type DNA-binding protein